MSDMLKRAEECAERYKDEGHDNVYQIVWELIEEVNRLNDKLDEAAREMHRTD